MNKISREVNESVILSGLDEARKEEILKIKDSIDISTDSSILSLGSDISGEIKDLNKSVLQMVHVKDIPEIEDILPKLNEAFSEVDSSSLLSNRKQSIFSRLFGKNTVAEFMMKLESAESVVGSLQSNLQKIEMELRKDIELEDELGRQNLARISQLENLIYAIKLRLNDLLNEIEGMESKLDGSDFVSLQYLENKKETADSLDKQLLWLEQQKLLAIQTLPILRNLKSSNKDLIRQITLTINQSIPAWEQGIIIAFHLHRQEGALRVERTIHDITNKIVLQNSQLLKSSSIEIAKAVESGMIDVETFREANKNLIETSEKLNEIKAISIQNRRKHILEYRELTQKLLDSERRDLNELEATRVYRLGEKL